MKSSEYNYQPSPSVDIDDERWFNEGGHVLPTDEIVNDEATLPELEDDTSSET